MISKAPLPNPKAGKNRITDHPAAVLKSGLWLMVCALVAATVVLPGWLKHRAQPPANTLEYLISVTGGEPGTNAVPGNAPVSGAPAAGKRDPASTLALDPATHGPLRVSSVNPRYFSDASGKIVYLTGSHTWANFQDNGNGFPPPVFDYAAYLNFLVDHNHNFFRLWTWEQSRWTLETTDNAYWFNPMGPFARTGPGTALDGKPKFNLTQFDQAYFDRMRARIIQARERGIYVSVMLFDGWSIANLKGGSAKNNPWKGHPFNLSNNINNVNGDPNGRNNGLNTQDLSIQAVTDIQEAYVRKVIDTVNDLDNVLYEIVNEGDKSSVAWQYHLIRWIQSYEAGKPYQHPVGMTSAYPEGRDTDLFNSPADWVSPNNNSNDYFGNPPAASGKKVILSDTDHLCGICGDKTFVWKSFTRGINPIFMDGYDGEAYGVGGAGFNPNDPKWQLLRANLGYTRAYAEKMNLADMTPQGNLCSTGYCLANQSATGAKILVYASPGVGSFTVDLTFVKTSVDYEWLNPQTGQVVKGTLINGGAKRTFYPPFNGDAVLYIAKSSLPTEFTYLPLIGR